MFALARQSTSALRNSALTGTPAIISRGYAEGQGQLDKKERAEEATYARKQEAEKIAKLREKLKQQREHLDSIEKDLNEIHGKAQ